MKYVILLASALLKFVTAASLLKTCSRNELCVDVRSCFPNEEDVLSWPWTQRNWKTLKSNICKTEKIDGLWVVNVCCPTELNARDCGISSHERMSYGKAARPFEFPWMVLLRNEWGSFVCGGTLITAQFVLTAAHCDGEIVSVRVGENDISKEEDCNYVDEQKECTAKPQDIEMDQFISHPKNSERWKMHDIALIRLIRSAKLSDSVKPICLPYGIPSRTVPDQLYVTGWGITEKGNSFDVLRYGSVLPMSVDECNRKIRRYYSYITVDEDSQFCTHGGSNRANTCQGDSGGPLQTDIYLGKTRFVQYGVVSYGKSKCGDHDEATVYTSVLPYLDWIFKTVKGNYSTKTAL